MAIKKFSMFGKTLFEWESNNGAMTTDTHSENAVPMAISDSLPLNINQSIDSGPAVGNVYYAAQVFDGEKNLGEFGPVMHYVIDYYAMRVRSRELYLMSDICHAAINKYKQWVVGGGLILKAEPQSELLSYKKVTLDTERFNKRVESLWKVQANSTMMDHRGKKTMNELEEEAFTERIIGGDMLVVLRTVGAVVTVQHIDGMHLRNPYNVKFDGNDYRVTDTNNRVRWGVEINDMGEHVAYWVRVGRGAGDFKRIKARDSMGMIRAYLITGTTDSIDGERAMPLLGAVMETAKKVDRYMGAALSGAEARADIDYVIEQKEYSDDEDAFITRKARASQGTVSGGNVNVSEDLPETKEGRKLADLVQTTTGHTTVFMPKGQTLKSPFDGKMELTVEEFGMFNIRILCAAIGIPPNVAMSEYNNSFSSSRMAGKDWENKFKKDRKKFAQQYLDPIYKLQVYVWVLYLEVNAPGFSEALRTKNRLLVEAYLYCRWTGDNFPDIDPLKTANALRKMLGSSFDHVPIGNMEYATECMDAGEYESNIRQAGEELEIAAENGIVPPAEMNYTNPAPSPDDSEEEPDDKEEEPADEETD